MHKVIISMVAIISSSGCIGDSPQVIQDIFFMPSVDSISDGKWAFNSSAFMENLPRFNASSGELICQGLSILDVKTIRDLSKDKLLTKTECDTARKESLSVQWTNDPTVFGDADVYQYAVDYLSGLEISNAWAWSNNYIFTHLKPLTQN